MRHGWFQIAGIQTGERTLKEAVKGLGAIAKAAKNATVLDLGCAEGLVGKWLIDSAGARTVHGLDLHEPFLEMAQQLHADYGNRAQFFHADLDHFEAWLAHNPNALLPRYDIVLALRIVQKLARPERFLQLIAGMCGRMLALNLPDDVIDDRRSGNVIVNPSAVLAGDFELVDSTREAIGVRKVFKRIGADK
jgi:predicted TPR repeat methyltransferase